MDVKQNGEHYPVYLINQAYGCRGIDYPANNNANGICLIIAS